MFQTIGRMDATGMLLTAVSVILMSVVVRWCVRRRRSLRAFKERGIPGPEPSFLDGNLFELKHRGKSENDVISGWIKQYGNVFGFFMGAQPSLVLNDVEILKQVLIKDFQHFSGRPDLFTDFHPIDNSIFHVPSRRWKEFRSILSPTFSSGKIKLMSKVMKKKIDITLRVVGEKARRKEMFDIHEVCQALTLDVIADCALAMKTRCQEDPNDYFLVAAREFVHAINNPAMDVMAMFPFLTAPMKLLSRFLKVGRTVSYIVRHLMHAIRERRRATGARSVDLVQLMLDAAAEDKTDNKMSDKEIIGNAFSFLIAGYETTSTALGFTFGCLVTHPEVQDRLHAEIEDVQGCDYNTVQDLTYLDQVFNESLRLYPPVTLFVTRRCNKEVKVGDITIPAGMDVMSPTWDIHHDPDHWPDPHKFDPDRFAPENKSRIKNLAFQAFGAGPRNCIGSRFAQLEAKTAIFRLLKEFRFEKCEKTDDPIALKVVNVLTQPKNGVWVRAVPRHQ